jgi:AcrR family transcriptional regulator
MAAKREIPPSPFERIPRRSSRTRRDPITPDAIVDVAMKVLDAEGLDGLSMRAIAEELDTGAASLYWHVGSKDGLLDLVMDRIVGEQRVPDPQAHRWQEQLKEVAHDLRATILRHRDVVRISIGRIPMGPNAVNYSERVLAIMQAGGVPDELAVQGYLLLIAAVNGFTLDETGVGSEEPIPADELEAGANMARDYLASLPADAFPNLTRVADHFAMSDPDQRFGLLVDIFVGGLAERAATAKA